MEEPRYTNFSYWFIPPWLKRRRLRVVTVKMSEELLQQIDDVVMMHREMGIQTNRSEVIREAVKLYIRTVLNHRPRKHEEEGNV